MSFAGRELLGSGLFVPTPEAIEFIEGDPTFEISREHPPSEKRSDNPKNKINIIVVFILGTLIFFLLFSWFNIIQLLIDIFWEEFWPTEDDKMRNGVKYSLVKQITFTAVITIIFFVFLRLYLSYDN